ncbi:uncharacterized protein LOC132193553 [Neocloeon triangulifer]|uniref:uncharacterized protein LOC132193553 n=1 Tax=Neocloeon triangulifer TaxID=2078957 RepID=UPI00286F34EF|nr:uncharacterized protein LOC132193553 [Neocloeon triangulifer]XP_059470277.1 uncharacterized protein LOC132193553 [Neocloeon triangulifer]XP_059470278.1 uncharacterized protein LOC132193553 [Neocloeon triangulifer]XP_059470279.1 uncharacterized protein LOC132193553 [Neocloeon triangulifer]
MAANVAPWLDTTGLPVDTVAALRGPAIPTLQFLQNLPKIELTTALQNNLGVAHLGWGRPALALELRGFLLMANRAVKPAVLCMRCHTREAKLIFIECMHFGVCTTCQEIMLDFDMHRQGDERQCKCPECGARHTQEDMRDVNVVQ